MSLNHLTTNTQDNKFFNPCFNTLKINNGLNMNNSGLTNVSSINGVPLPPLVIDLNPVNIIYEPGSTPGAGSNIVNSWADVIVKASRLNVNELLNIHFDSTLVTPCVIDASHDFKGRANFYSANSNLTSIAVYINDGVLISNLRTINNVNLVCQSITGPNLAFNAVSTTVYLNHSYITNTSDSLVPSLVIDNADLYIYVSGNSYLSNLGNPAISTVSILNTGQLSIYCNDNSISASNFNNSIGDDGTGTLSFNSDSSLTGFPTFASFTGTYNQTLYDLSSSVSYDDTKSLPAWTTSNVQSSLDHVKSSYLPISSTNAMTAGSINCGAITSTGNFTNGTNSLMSGSLSCGAISSNNTFTNGTNSMTTGQITSSGNFNNGTNSMTTGSLSCTSLTSTGVISQPQYYSIVTFPSTSAITISSASWTALTWQSQLTGSNFSFTPGDFNVTIPVNAGGLYALSFATSFQPNAVGTRNFGISINNSTSDQSALTTIPATATDNQRYSGADFRRLVAGDTVSVLVYQNSGGNLDIGNDTLTVHHLSVVRLFT